MNSALTSFFATGLSARTRCVKCENLRKGSKSASSVKLFEDKTRFFRFGIDVASVFWIVTTRLRASRSVEIRGESGKFPSTWISLSVKSIAS